MHLHIASIQLSTDTVKCLKSLYNACPSPHGTGDPKCFVYLLFPDFLTVGSECCIYFLVVPQFITDAGLKLQFTFQYRIYLPFHLYLNDMSHLHSWLKAQTGMAF